MTLEEKIERFVCLAKEWREFSKNEHGWEVQEYHSSDDWTVMCYFADNSDHTAVNISHRHHDLISIGFHYSPTIELSLKHIDKINDTLDKAESMLLQERDKAVKRSQEEKEEERLQKIAAAKKVLIELGELTE